MVEEILASTEKKMPEQRMLEPEKLDTAWNALLFLSWNLVLNEKSELPRVQQIWLSA